MKEEQYLEIMVNKIYSEDDLIHVSALADFTFCERRTALHFIEMIWDENIFTAEGRILHERVHEDQFEMREGIRIERGIPLKSQRLGLIGKADVVEFYKKSESNSWLPFPVEYKRGHLRHERSFEVQLCAQALCLEEMLGVDVPAGAIFYGKTRRRMDVAFDDALRKETEETAHRLREFIKAGKTPKAEYSKKCESCSLKELCMPKTLGGGRSARRYLKEMLEARDE